MMRMPRKLLVAVVASWLCLATASVTQITDEDNFDALISEYDVALVAFTAPWCGHCKALKPVYEQVGASIKSNLPDESVLIAQVDATSATKLATRFGIRGYPTLLTFAQGQMYQFKGARSVDALLLWVQGGWKQAGVSGEAIPRLPSDGTDDASAVQTLTDATFEHDTQASTGSTTGDWFVFFGAPWCGHCKKLTPQFNEAAKLVKEQHLPVSFAKVDCTADASTCKRFGVKGYPTLYYISRGRMAQYSGARDAHSIVSWASGNPVSGAAEQDSKPVPAPLGWWTWIASDFQDLSTHIRRFWHASAAAVVVIFLVGILAGAVLVGTVTSLAPVPVGAPDDLIPPTPAVSTGAESKKTQ